MQAVCRTVFGDQVPCPCVGGTILAVGLNHATAPIAVRDRMTVGPGEMPDALLDLARRPAVGEVALLSTCNRTEIYILARDGAFLGEMVQFLQQRAKLSGAEAGQMLYALRDRAAVDHLFEVAAGLDSLILGEPQILGQTRDAVRLAREQGTVGRMLNGLFDSAFKAAKRARTETGIAEGAVSISFAAVELARKIFGDLDDKEVLILGAGKMSRLTLDNLREQGARACFIANRSREKAEQLARDFNAAVHPWDRLEEALARMDIVIASTAAPHYVLTSAVLRRAMKVRRNRPIFLVDIAAPRDVEPEAGDLYNVFLYNIDDLKSVVEENLANRAREADRAREILRQEADGFWAWSRSLQANGAIVQLRDWADRQREAELERLMDRTDGFSPEQRKAIEEFSRRLMNKFLDRPSRGVKTAYRADQEEARGDDSESLGAMALNGLKHLFGLGETSAPRPPGDAAMAPTPTAPPASGAAPTPADVLDDTDRRLCDLLQRDFPLTARPFAALGEKLAIPEAQALERTRRLKASGLVRQISAIFDSAQVGYRSLLAAFEVAADQLDKVAAFVARHEGVSHAYERAHRLNFWFTLTCPPGMDPEAECARLAEELNVAAWVALPATRTYKIGVMLPMGEDVADPPGAATAPARPATDAAEDPAAPRRLPCACDRALIRVLQQDLPLVEEPFRPWADQLGLSQEALLKQARELLTRGMMRRFAAVLRHRRAGFGANGMACWQAPPEDLDRIGPLVAQSAAVSHCYARRPAPPLWTHNLFAMIHGRSPAEVDQTVNDIRLRTGLPEPEVLYSGREFKKSRARYYMSPDFDGPDGLAPAPVAAPGDQR